MDKKRILIIEDETDLALMIQTRLEVTGYEAEIVTDGEQGLAKVRSDHPDLILLDIIMPKVDGLEVCRQLKADSATKAIPIIIITASGRKDAEEQCLSAGAAFCVRKPFDSQKLIEKIQSLLI